MLDERKAHPNIRGSNVSGTKVYSREGEHLGYIDDLVIGKTNGRVQYVIMCFGSFLGMGGYFHPMPWERLEYDCSKQGYVVDMKRQDLEKAPHYAGGMEPDWNDEQWGRNVYNYYGIAPYF